MKNRIWCLIFTLLLIAGISNISFASGRWVKVDDNWRYELHAGSRDYVTSKWKTIFENGVTEKVYYFDYYGNMQTGPIIIDGDLYVYSDQGDAVLTGFDIDGIHYDTDGKGKVLGLPAFFNYSEYKQVATIFSVNSGFATANKTVYDDNIMPTAAAN